MKFKDGYMISSGGPTRDYIDSAVRHVMLRQVRRIDDVAGLGIAVPDNQHGLCSIARSA